MFFAGSLFFTSAAALQYLESVNVDRRRLRVFAFEPGRIDWWATVIQLAGTLFFNLSTFHALQTSLSTGQEDRLIWRPDAFGSICFLVASALAWVEVCGVAIRGPRRQVEWWIVAVNLAGSVAFGVSAVAGYVVPATGDDLDLAAANVTTSVGALFFLVGAVLLLVEAAHALAPRDPSRWRPHDPHLLTAPADRPAVARGAGGRRDEDRLRPDLAQGAEEARRARRRARS